MNKKPENKTEVKPKKQKKSTKSVGSSKHSMSADEFKRLKQQNIDSGKEIIIDPGMLSDHDRAIDDLNFFAGIAELGSESDIDPLYIYQHMVSQINENLIDIIDKMNKAGLLEHEACKKLGWNILILDNMTAQPHCTNFNINQEYMSRVKEEARSHIETLANNAIDYYNMLPDEDEDDPDYN